MGEEHRLQLLRSGGADAGDRSKFTLHSNVWWLACSEVEVRSLGVDRRDEQFIESCAGTLGGEGRSGGRELGIECGGRPRRGGRRRRTEGLGEERSALLVESIPFVVAGSCDLRHEVELRTFPARREDVSELVKPGLTIWKVVSSVGRPSRSCVRDYQYGRNPSPHRRDSR